MSTAITFLSGKGGSGKTTLALSLADLLSRCGIKTLLVDCDLSTNGATYFYESQLNEQNKSNASKVSSFFDVLAMHKWPKELTLLNVGPKFDFIPSVSEISAQYLVGGVSQHIDKLTYTLSRFLDWAKENYDAILFDCQAGYSEFLPYLLPLVDVDLFVLEADSVSASAMRSLHLKIGNYLGPARIYQIFNKATPEEFEIYSKIVGTFFVNIGTMMFDWKIRQAFSRSQIPDFENTSAKYGVDLCNICNIILPDKNSHIKVTHFSSRLLDKKLEKEQGNIESILMELRRKSNTFPKHSSYVLTIPILIVNLTSLFYIFSSESHDKFFYLLLSVFTIIFISVVSIYFDTKNMNSEARKEQLRYEQKLKDLKSERTKLKTDIKKSVDGLHS